MLGIVLLEERTICLQHSKLRDCVTLAFDASDNFADQTTSYAIWLNEDKCLF
jgi:hypothetical protein